MKSLISKLLHHKLVYPVGSSTSNKPKSVPESVLLIVQRCITVSNIYSGVTVYFDSASNSVKEVTSSRIKCIKLRFMMSTVAYLVILYQSYASWQSLDFSIKTFVALANFGYFTGLCVTYACIKYSKLTAGLINSTYNVNSRMNISITSQTEAQQLTKIKGTAYLYLTLAVAPAVFQVFILVFPCLPLFVGSSILPECQAQDYIRQQNKFQSTSIKLLIAATTFYSHTIIMGPVMLHMCLALLQCYSFIFQLKSYYR